MSNLRETCGECGRKYTAEEMKAKREAQRQNAMNSRAKAAANGKRVGRPRRITAKDAWDAREYGLSIRAIAHRFGVSPSAVYRRLQEKP